jgi:hypothetical protein
MANQQASPTDAKRSAQGTITRDPSGEQRKLDKGNYDFQDLRFPLDVGNIEKRLHCVKFTPCIQQKSSYQVKTVQGADGASIADRNRASRTGAGSADPFSVAGAIGVTAGLGLLGGIEKFAGAAEGIAGEFAQGDVRGVAREFGQAAAGAVGAQVGAIASGVIVGSINLSRKTKRAASAITLYMPDTVTQQLVNDYDQVSLTAALGKAGLVAAAGQSIGEAIGLAGREGGNLGLGGGGVGADTGKGALAEVGGAIAEKTGNFGAGITDVLLFSAGVALNPQVELLFKNIQNREFMFDFKFAPRNQKETDVIHKIIKTFRFFAAPEVPTTNSGRYFIPPSEFEIEFQIGSQKNPYLPFISTCVLQGIDVNYGSAGQWTAFRDGAPVEISMQLRFKEVEIMHKELIAQGY